MLRARGVCKASNAFCSESLLRSVLLEPSRSCVRRSFSISRESRQEVEHAITDTVLSEKALPIRKEFSGPEIRARQKNREAGLYHARHLKNIDPSSLSNTLRWHRNTNQAANDFKNNLPTRPSNVDRPARNYYNKRLILDSIAKDEKPLEQEEVQTAGEHGSLSSIVEKVGKGWFHHLNIDIGSVTGKENLIVRKKLQRRQTGAVLDYEGQYVLPHEKEMADPQEIPWLVRDDAFQGFRRSVSLCNSKVTRC